MNAFASGVIAASMYLIASNFFIGGFQPNPDLPLAVVAFGIGFGVRKILG